MKIQPGELRLAWALLILLAVLAFPHSPPPGPITLFVSCLGFLPGALILANPRGSARIASEVESLLAGSVGRISVIAGLTVAGLVGLIFTPFMALYLSGVASEIVVLVLLASPKASLARFFPALAIGATATLIMLVAADVALNWRSIARQLGTPSELAQWKGRYDDVKANNFFHFRSPYEDTRRRAGVRRIITLGDSFTDGHGIWSSDSTWPAQLERELTGGPDGQPTEVVNMGHGGFTTANEAELLRRIGWQFDPDLVIVQWLDNDAYRSYPNFGFEEAQAVRIIPQRFRSGLIQQSAILALLEGALSAAKEAPMRSLYTPEAEGRHQLEAALAEMADSARRRCVPILLVAYPYLFPGTWTSETYPERDLNRLVTDAARKDGFEALDLTDVFATTTHPEQDWWVTPYDSHPNATGQHRATLAIARLIRERHLLPETPGSHPRCQ